MNAPFWIPILVIASSAVTGILIFFLSEKHSMTRTVLNMTGATVKLVLVIYMCWAAYRGEEFETRFAIVLGFDFLLRADMLSLLLVTLSSVLWWFTTVYAIGYLEGSPNRSRFFGFFSLSVTASVGVALAGNLITFFIFYELLTLSTYPLVVHRGTEEALQAGRTYLWYTLAGGAALFVGAVWVHTLVGSFDFEPAGVVAHLTGTHRPHLIAIFVILILGLGVKAALVPLHAWLPIAMIAPAPVSALLHAVAVVKAGAFGICRVVYDVFGLEAAAELGVLTPLAVLASATILYGSIRALAQDDLKRRLAFSTVSQVSYIALGVSLFGFTASTGGLVHLVHQGLMKITLFFCAGLLAETIDVKSISQMNGVARRMPWTLIAFTLAAFGMIGMPPIAGFVTKWHLGVGGMEAGHPWVIGVMLLSSVLNAAYFLPILYVAWFKPPTRRWPEFDENKGEASRLLLWPTLATAVLSLLAGIFAGTGFSPLALARTIAEVYVP